MDRKIDGGVDGEGRYRYIDIGVNGQIEVQMDTQMDRQIHRGVDRWVERCRWIVERCRWIDKDGQIHGLRGVDGQIGRQIEVQIDR